uniref:Uncharacterized protein n=1 Tax=Cacopsylla melanoneura TaxID=428564 RepID=A0A8D9B8S0_9HEMI
MTEIQKDNFVLILSFNSSERKGTKSPRRNKFGLHKTDNLLSPCVYTMRNCTPQSIIIQNKKDKEEVTKPKKFEVEKTHRLKRGQSMLPVPLRPYKRMSM